MTSLIEGSIGKTVAAGVLFLGIATVGWLVLNHSIDLFSGNRIPGDPGPFFLGHLCLGIIAIAGAILLALAGWAAATTERVFIPTPFLIEIARDWALPAGFVASLIMMPTAMRAMGTPIAVAVFSIGWIYILLAMISGHSRSNGIEALLFGGATAGFVYLFFLRLLTLPLPT